MSDDEEEEEDLWGDLEDLPSNIAISANLLAVTDAPGKKVTFDQPDESTITWVAPAFAGLDNSSAVGAKGSWYAEGSSQKKTQPAGATDPIPVTPGASAAMPTQAGSQVAPAATSPAVTPLAPAETSKAPLETPKTPAAAPSVATPTGTGPAETLKAAFEAAPAPTFNLPKTAAGGIDWGAMGSLAPVKASS